MFIKGLYMLLTQDAGVSAIVGKRVYYILQPKGTIVPSIVLSCVSTSDLYTMSGITGFREGSWQVDCYASDYYSSIGLQSAVRSLLENYMGNLPDTDATPVTATFIDKAWDMPYEEGSKGFIYRSLLGVRFHYYDTSLPVSTSSDSEAVIDGGIS